MATVQQILRKEARHADKYGYNDPTHNSREERHAFTLDVLATLIKQDKERNN